MEVPRNWRLQKWRYRLQVTIPDSDNKKVQNEVPTGVKNFAETGGFYHIPLALEVIDELTELIPA